MALFTAPSDREAKALPDESLWSRLSVVRASQADDFQTWSKLPAPTYSTHDDSSRLPHRLMCTIDCDQNQLDGSLDGDSETHKNRAQLNGSRFYAMRNYYCAAICITCIATRYWTKCFLLDIPSGNRLKCLQIQQNTPATHTICFIVIYLQRIYI